MLGDEILHELTKDTCRVPVCCMTTVAYHPKTPCMLYDRIDC